MTDRPPAPEDKVLVGHMANPQENPQDIEPTLSALLTVYCQAPKERIYDYLVRDMICRTDFWGIGFTPSYEEMVTRLAGKCVTDTDILKQQASSTVKACVQENKDCMEWLRKIFRETSVSFDVDNEHTGSFRLVKVTVSQDRDAARRRR